MSSLGYSVGCVILLTTLFSIVQASAVFGPSHLPPPCNSWEPPHEGCHAVKWSSDPFNKKVYYKPTVVIMNAFLKKRTQLWVKCQSQHHNVDGIMLQPGGRLEFEAEGWPGECGWFKDCTEKYWCYMDWIDPVDKKKYGLTLNAVGYHPSYDEFQDAASKYSNLYEFIVNKDGIWMPSLDDLGLENPYSLTITLRRDKFQEIHY